MSDNNNQTIQQQEQNPNAPAKEVPGDRQKNPNEVEKQAPGYNETPETRDQDNGGEVNQQDPAWRPGDEPADRSASKSGTGEEADSSEQSQGQRAGGSGF